MPKKIIDQWTDRTDLSATRKFRLRNPDYSKAWNRSEAGKAAHKRYFQSEKGAAAIKRSYKKDLLKRISIAQEVVVKSVLTPKQNLGKYFRKEALSLLKRGKDPAMVAIWLNIPMSAITELQKEIVTETQKVLDK